MKDLVEAVRYHQDSIPRKLERCVSRSHEAENNPLKGRNRLSQSVAGIEEIELECMPHQSAIVTTTDQYAKLLVWYVNHAITDDFILEHMRWEIFQLYEEQGQVPPNCPLPEKLAISVSEERRASSSRSFWQSPPGGGEIHTIVRGHGECSNHGI